MKHLLNRLLLILLLLQTGYAVSQDRQELPYVPASPAAAGISQVGNTSVNLYTGTPGITIPLHTFSTRKLQLPVVLQYQGQSIKVQDIAGPVGLGWALQAGGAITRTVRGIPDGQANGYSATTNPTGGLISGSVTTTQYADLVKKVSSGEWDGEPDVFTSSAGGKFVITGNMEAQFMQPTGYEVKQIGLYHRIPWIITDPYGNQYIFGSSQSSTEVVEYSSGTDPSKSHTSVWYIDRIVSADGTDTISFTYTAGPSNNYYYYKKFKTQKVYPCSGTEESKETAENLHVEVPAPKYLSSIKGKAFSVVLQYENRKDLTGALCLKSITINRTFGVVTEQLQQYVFRYGYFKDANGQENSRLKLASIYTADINGYRKQLADFTYNEAINLPPRNSIQFDHWGYYNNNQANTSLPPAADKTSDSQRMMANILTRINWKSGGSTTYQYEPNTYQIEETERTGGGVRIAAITNSDPLSGTTLTTRYHYKLEDGKTSGLLYNDQPENSYYYRVFLAYPSASDYPGGGTVDNCSGYVNYWHDQTYTDLFDLYGVALGYSRVEVENQDKSREINIFSDLKDWSRDYVDLHYFYLSGSVRSYPRAGYTNQYRFGPPFACLTSYGFMRGLIREKRLMKADGSLQGKFVYTYSPYIDESRKVQGLRVMQSFNSQGRLWIAGRYDEMTALAHLSSVLEQAFPEGENGKVITTFKRFEYSSKDPYLVKRIIESGVAGDSLITQYTYPRDLTGTPNTSAIYDLLDEQHIHALPVEEVHLLQRDNNMKVTSGIVNLYTAGHINNQYKVLFSRKLVLTIHDPISDYQWLTSAAIYDSRYEESLKIDLYDAKGNIAAYTTKGNMMHTSLWDAATGGYKLAEATNAKAGEVYYMGFEPIESYSSLHPSYIRTDGGHTGERYYTANFTLNFTPANHKACKLSYWYKQNGHWNYSGELDYVAGMSINARDGLDDIRIYPEKSRMTTYTYEPLIGLESQTNANNVTEYYEYDSEQRLSTVRDKNRNIVKLYNYRYQAAETAGSSPCGQVPNITVNRTAANAWTVSWTPVADAGGYKVEYRKESDDPWTSFQTSTTSHILTGLQLTSFYEVRVSVLCTDNQIQPSDILAFRTSKNLMTINARLTTGLEPRNQAILTATLATASDVPIAFQWGQCTVNNSIDPNFWYCDGYPGSSHGGPASTTYIEAGVTSVSQSSATYTPGANFGSLKRIVIHNITNIDPFDIRKVDGENFELIIQQ